MKLSSAVAAMCLVAASAPWLSAQIVSSTLTGTVVDPANAVIAGADASLKDQATGAERSAKTNGEGSFRFLDIGAGTYTLTIKASGFSTHVQKDIEVQTSATRDIGRVAMALGNITDQITVTADAANIELSSSEKSHAVDITQIENMPTRGRDIFQFIGTLPGMIDTNNANTGVGTGSHDFRNAYSVGGLSMNGNTSMMNVTVDGLTGMDVGCGNCLLEGNPNMDAVAEVKILSSNYSAEYGRNSGGTITLATKSGTQAFHGSGWWTHRHEEFNANSFFNNIGGAPRPKYRFNISGYSIGGPVYIPHKFNTGRTKLFFFASEEWSALFPGASLVQKNMPTALERAGDFSQSVDTNGKLIKVVDPENGVQFTNNQIPQSRFDPTGVGVKILNFFPLPNYAPAPGTPNYRKYNYQALIGGQHPIRNDVARVDMNPTSKIAAYIRMVRDDDKTTDPQAGFDFVYSPQTHPLPSYNYSGAITWTIRPTLVNEFNVGKAGSDWNYYYNDPSNLVRSVFNNPPKLFPVDFNDPSTVSSLSGSNLHMYNF
ncbi:MAG TPA: TonB-dependent receptor, partial [Bryobacteraceae bacterium]